MLSADIDTLPALVDSTADCTQIVGSGTVFAITMVQVYMPLAFVVISGVFKLRNAVLLNPKKA